MIACLNTAYYNFTYFWCFCLALVLNKMPFRERQYKATILPTPLQHVFSVTIFRLPRRLENVLKTSWRHLSKMFRRHLARREDVLKACLEDVFKTSWRQTKCLLRISVSNKCKCVSNKSIFHKSISDDP